MTQPLPTPEERIQAMHARVKAQQEAAAAAAELREQANAMANSLAYDLAEQLKGLRGLPVANPEKPGQKGDCVVFVHAASPGMEARICVGGPRFPLMTFVVGTSTASPQPEAWIEHDGTRISEETAADLATAAVERAFDLAMSPPQTAGQPLDEDDLPF